MFHHVQSLLNIYNIEALLRHYLSPCIVFTSPAFVALANFTSVSVMFLTWFGLYLRG